MLSVIIPTCNRNNLLAICLNSLDPSVQNISSDDYEVIVTDDSHDYIAKDLLQEHYQWARWVPGPQRGPAANRNNGAKKAAGEWLIFIDDDCVPKENWLASYQQAISSKECFVFEGATNADRPKRRFDEEAPINLTGNKLWSCNFAIKKDFFLQIGGFDELFSYAAMEDIDFYHRVLNHAGITFIPEALAIHPWRRVKPFANFKKHLRSHKYFAKKNGLYGTAPYRWSRVKIFAGSLFSNFGILMRFSMRGWPVYIEKCVFYFCLIFI